MSANQWDLLKGILFLLEPQNDLVKVGILGVHLLLSPAQKGPSSKLSQLAWGLVQLNFAVSQGGVCTASLGSLSQCLTALLV